MCTVAGLTEAPERGSFRQNPGDMKDRRAHPNAGEKVHQREEVGKIRLRTVTK